MSTLGPVAIDGSFGRNGRNIPPQACNGVRIVHILMSSLDLGGSGMMRSYFGSAKQDEPDYT